MSHDTIIPAEPAVDAYLTHLNRAGWGRCFTDEVRYSVAYTALQLGLDPVLRELWVTDENEICITVAGLAKMAFRLGILDGFNCEPIAEAKGAEDVALWKGILYVKGSSQPIIEIAQAGGKEEKNPVAREYPNETARTKARGRCLKAAMGIGLPLWEDLQGKTDRRQAVREKNSSQPSRQPTARRRPAPSFADDTTVARFRKLADGAGLDAHAQIELLREESRRLNRSFEVRRDGDGYNLRRVPRALMSSAIARLEKEGQGRKHRDHAATSTV